MRGTLLLLMVALTLLGGPAAFAHADDDRPPVEQRTVAVSAPVADSRAEDEQTAVAVVDEFWRRYFAGIGASYRSPRVVGSYTASTAPTCGGEPVAAGNALYCTAGDYVAWDDDLMDAGYRQIGDAWVYVVVAHEWAHAIQVRLDRADASTETELEADCLAGAALQGSADAGLVRMEAGDDQELLRSFAIAGDDGSVTDEGVSHGTGQQRTSAFERGVSGGVAACL